MSNVKDYIKLLEEDKSFRDWKDSNPDSYLCHCFKMIDEANENEWQIGFYNPNDTITSFLVSEDSVQQMEESEVFKKPDAQVKELDLDKVKIDEKQAIGAAKEFAQKQYPKEVITKQILILQNLEIGQVYNITLVTMAMNTLNIKVDSVTRDIVDNKLTSLMDFAIDRK